MKTFETEKNNIPEGATHYWNETDSGLFAWWRDDTKQMLCPERHSDWTNQRDISDDLMHEIPKPETTEWNGEGLPTVGIECEVRFRDDGEWTDWFANSKFKAGYGSKLWFSYEFGECVYPAHDVEFRKPESPEEKEKRERLEAAYDLYSSWVSNTYGETLFCFKAFCDTPELCTKWLAIVDKTNYRKGE